MGAQTAALLAGYAALKRAHADAVVTVEVQVSANEAVTVDGLRGGVMVARGAARGALSNAVDTSVVVPAAPFADPMTLCGKDCKITDKAGVVIVGRLLPVRVHALGGLLTLAVGEWDRVTA